MKQNKAETKAQKENHTAKLKKEQVFGDGSNSNQVDKQLCNHDTHRNEQCYGDWGIDRFPAGYREIVVD